MATIQCSMVCYDIPASVRMPNPSAEFRRIGVRTTESCWVIPNPRIPYETLNRIRQNGGEWIAVKFDASEAAVLAGIAVASITKDLIAAQESLQTSRDRSETRLRNELAAIAIDPTKTAVDIADAERAHWDRIRGQVYQVRKLLADLRVAAEIFGVDCNGLIRNVTALAQTIRNAAYLRASAFVRAKRTLSHVYPAMAATLAENPERAAPVAADYLEETGETEAAAELRDSFAPSWAIDNGAW